MKILRTSDIVTLKAEGIEVDFSPLSYERSLELSDCTKVVAGETVVDGRKQTQMLIKYAVKEIRGATDYDNKPITLKAVNNMMSDSDITDSINVLVHTKFVYPLSYISNSARPKGFDGVEILVNGKPIELGNEN
jgi:menaquinone-dependent protoporphyrinogen IX oxidase